MSASIFDREVNTDVQCKKCHQWFPDELALDAHYEDIALLSHRAKCAPIDYEVIHALPLHFKFFYLDFEQEVKWNNTHSVCVDDR